MVFNLRLDWGVLKVRLLATETVAIMAVLAVPVHAQTSATPIFDAIEAYDKANKPKGYEKNTQCLLALKTYDYATDELGMDKPDSKKAVRAKKVVPVMEAYLYESAQTKTNFDRAVTSIKAEYAQFKSADKKEQKRLFGIAKSANKRCSKRQQNTKLEAIGRMRKVAELIPAMSSEKARNCMAIALNPSSISNRDALFSFIQGVTWEKVYQKELRREGHPDDEIIESIDYLEEKERVKEIDSGTALSLYEECPKMYAKAEFTQKLEKTDESGERVSLVNWD